MQIVLFKKCEYILTEWRQRLYLRLIHFGTFFSVKSWVILVGKIVHIYQVNMQGK